MMNTKNYFVNFSEMNENYLGSKFENLKALSNYFDVPKAVCISSEFLNDQMENYLENIDCFRMFFKDLESTAGCYLLDTYPKIEKMVAGFHFSDEAVSIIKNELNLNFESEVGIKLAVRSSASHEDTENNSFAGVYNTVLNISSYDGVVDSIQQVLKQYYKYGAIVARIRSNNYKPEVELNIIVQIMVNSKISGVAFSTSSYSNGNVLIEWVDGLGEQLVSGEKEANIYYKGIEETEEIKEVKEILIDVESKVKKIKGILGYDVDVEWGYDGQKVYILQARPITDEYFLNKSKEGIFEYDKLYFETDIENKNNLGSCKKVYENYTGKRSSFYVLARSNNINYGEGYVLHFNKEGLQKNRGKLEELFNNPVCKNVVIDVDDAIRQNIIPKDELFSYLDNLFGAYSNIQENTVVVRMFIKGVYGCISHLLPNNEVIIEYSKDGLLAMNRGLASCKEFLIDSDSEIISDSGDISKECIKDIVKFTRELKSSKDRYMIEWVINDGKAYFVDISTEYDVGVECLQKSSVNKIIVPGNFGGPILSLDTETILERLSVSPGVSVNETNDILLQNPDLKDIIKRIKKMDKKPIVFVEKPFAILSFLFDYVEGFVFRQGSLLCHLSILLREYKKPAIICAESKEFINEYNEVLIINGKILGN